MVQFSNCINCFKRFKKQSPSHKFCTITCNGEHKRKIEKIQYKKLSESVFDMVRKGVDSHEEISKVLGIPIKSVRTVIPHHITNIQKWYKELKQDQENKKNLTLPKESKKIGI